MAEATNEPPATGPTTNQPPPAIPPPPSPDDTSSEVEKWKAMARKHEAEAKTNAGAAKKLAEIEEAAKTEAQKNADRLAAAEQAAAAATREALKFKIASKFQIGDEDADLFLNGPDEDTLTRQAKRLVDREGDRKKQGNHVSRVGTESSTPAENELKTFAHQLLSGNT